MNITAHYTQTTKASGAKAVFDDTVYKTVTEKRQKRHNRASLSRLTCATKSDTDVQYGLFDDRKIKQKYQQSYNVRCPGGHWTTAEALYKCRHRGRHDNIFGKVKSAAHGPQLQPTFYKRSMTQDNK